MSEIDPIVVGTHGGAGILGGLIVYLKGWWDDRDRKDEAKAVDDKLGKLVTGMALIEQQLTGVLLTLKDHQTVAIDVALLKRDVQALHERLDGNRAPR